MRVGFLFICLSLGMGHCTFPLYIMTIKVILGANAPIECTPAPQTTLSSVLADLGYEMSEVASATEGTSTSSGTHFPLEGLVRHNRTYYVTLSDEGDDYSEEEEVAEVTVPATPAGPQGEGQPLNEGDLAEMALLSRADLALLTAQLGNINQSIRKGDWKKDLALYVGEVLANAVCRQVCIRIGRALGYDPQYVRTYADRLGSIVAALGDSYIMESNKIKLKALFGL